MEHNRFCVRCNLEFHGEDKPPDHVCAEPRCPARNLSGSARCSLTDGHTGDHESHDGKTFVVRWRKTYGS